MKLQDKTTAVFRLVHVDNLAVYLQRGALHAAAHAPDDGLAWRGTHREDVQQRRAQALVPAGPRGVLLDYVPFYFGPRSPMLYQLHSGWVPDYTEGQGSLVYLVVSVEDVVAAGLDYVFFDGHALGHLSQCFDSLDQLDQVDWTAVEARQWSDGEDPDLQRRKQAEFLIHRAMPWALVRGVAVFDDDMKARVEALWEALPTSVQRQVSIHRNWYY